MSLLKAMLMGGEYLPKDMFKVVTYVGTATERSITGIGFQPDFVWIKCRSVAYNNELYDNIRGATKAIYSDLTNAEATTTNAVISYDEDGFTIGANAGVNAGSSTYVAWCWKADNSAGVSNTDGSITSTVNAGKNFSIVKYTGTGANATVGHGLSTTPDFIFVKDLTNVNSWLVYNSNTGATKRLFLDTTAAAQVNSLTWNDTEPTDSVFSISTSTGVNGLNHQYIAYCFHNDVGISKIGTYTGTGASNTAVSCGFQPAYVMIKSSSHVASWVVYDNKRDPHNPNTLFIQLDGAVVEQTTTHYIDLTSTGFTLQSTAQGTNLLNATYEYMAFAELPTKDSPENHDVPLFNMIKYIGDATTGHNLDGLGFKPDLNILRPINYADNNVVVDSLRTSVMALYGNTTAAQVSVPTGVQGLNADGLTVGAWTNVNRNGYNHIAWCWNAGGEAVPNTDGSIESTVMANVTNGFSMIYATLTAGTDTVGHGLSSVPTRFVVKRLDSTGNHTVYDSIIGNTKHLLLNTTGAEVTSSTAWNSTSPTSTLLTLSTLFPAGDYIIYCFHSVAGVSDFGSYSGTGAVGNAVNIGLRPDYLRVKRTDSAESWIVFDSKRGGYTGNNQTLRSDTSGIEDVSAGVEVDFTSTGFILQGAHGGINASGGTYIYEAFKIQDNPNTLHQIETGDLLLSDALTDDNGTHTVTVNGSVTASTSDPATGTSKFIFGGGTGDYLTVPASTDWNFGTGDFTIDFWLNPVQMTAGDGLVYNANGVDNNTEYLRADIYSDGLQFRLRDAAAGNENNIYTTNCFTLDEWHHVALLRASGYMYFMVNGILNVTPIAADNDLQFGSTEGLKFGFGRGTSVTYNGAMDMIRITKGTALWTTTNFNLTDKGLYYPSGTLNI